MCREKHVHILFNVTGSYQHSQDNTHKLKISNKMWFFAQPSLHVCPSLSQNRIWINSNNESYTTCAKDRKSTVSEEWGKEDMEKEARQNLRVEAYWRFEHTHTTHPFDFDLNQQNFKFEHKYEKQIRGDGSRQPWSDFHSVIILSFHSPCLIRNSGMLQCRLECELSSHNVKHDVEYCKWMNRHDLEPLKHRRTPPTKQHQHCLLNE